MEDLVLANLDSVRHEMRSQIETNPLVGLARLRRGQSHREHRLQIDGWQCRQREFRPEPIGE